MSRIAYTVRSIQGVVELAADEGREVVVDSLTPAAARKLAGELLAAAFRAEKQMPKLEVTP